MKKCLWTVFLVFVCAAFIHLPAGWQNSTILSSVLAQEPNPEVQKIAVMPFFKGKRPEEIEEMVNCPVERLCFNQNDIQADADFILTRTVQRTVEDRFGEKVISMTDATAAYEKIFAAAEHKTPGILAKKLGEALGADHVVLGNVWRYRDRSDMTGNDPGGASVAFNIVLLRVETGQKVWKETFDKTQRTLTDNLLAKDAVNLGLKWISAKELARMGVREVFKKFPY